MTDDHNGTLSAAYRAGDRTRQPGKRWSVPSRTTAREDMRHNYAQARAFARDLTRNNSLAAGAKDVLVTNAVNVGLKLDSQIDYEQLGISKEQAAEKQRLLERLFNMWGENPRCDLEGHQTFSEQQALVLGSSWESGDVFVALPVINSNALVSRVRVQIIEGDRVKDPGNGMAAHIPNLWEGIEFDANGAPTSYWVEYTKYLEAGQPLAWKKVQPYARSTGCKQFLHLFQKKRPGQPRGYTALAPVVEDLKQLGDYKDYELKATLLASLFTVFVESEGGDALVGDDALDNFSEVNIGAANIVGLAPGERISTAEPGRPNSEFERFYEAVASEIGAGLGIPHELLMRRFQASYSASRAALLEAWKGFRMHRQWLATHFCKPVYVRFVDDLVSREVIDLPGYLQDPMAKAAWLKAEWIGMPREEIDPLKPAQADLIKVNLGTKSRDKVIREDSGMDFESVHAQVVEENEAREEAGINKILGERNGEVDTTPDDVEQRVTAGTISIQQLKEMTIVDDDGEVFELHLDD